MDTKAIPALRKTLAVTGGLALAATLASAGTATAAATHAPVTGAAATATGTSWARTVTGAIVPVSPTVSDAPIHPEAVTHPNSDSMGSTIASHDPGAANAAKAVVPNTVPQLPGIDVSSFQGDINWASVAPHIDFSYAKATEGTYYTNPDFTNQYEGPYNAGKIRGAYHFAIPNNSAGNTQADYFIAHGGGWSSDGKTLPGALDIEYNPYGATCYGLTASQMVSWIWSFVNEYAAREHVYPVIYTTTNWWQQCTGNNGGFGAYDPLWVANYSASGGGPLPAGWGYYTFWQYADSGSLPGDQDVFNGAYTQLQTLATKG